MRLPERSEEPSGEITDLIGRVGLWHWIILAVIFTNSVFNAYGQLAMAFMLPPNIAYNCSEPQDGDWLELVRKQGDGYCERLVNGTLIACNAWSYDHSVHKSTILEEWNLVCHNDNLKPYPQALSMAGLIIGNVVFSHFSDHYGRKPAVYVGMVICVISCVAATVTSNFTIFNIGRFLSSISKIGIQASIVIFIEAIEASYRWMFSLLNGYGFHLGMLAVAATGYYGDSWRYLQGLIGGPSVGVLPFLFFVWESPRWLLSQKRTKEGIQVIERICRMNNIPRTQVDFHLPAIRRKYENLRTTPSKNALDLLKNKPNTGKSMAPRTIILWYLCFTFGILFYSATFMSTSLGSSPHVSFSIPIIGELIAITFVAVGVKFMRRKLIVLVTAILSAVGFFMLAFRHQLVAEQSDYFVQMAAIILIRSASAAFTQIYPVYSAEIYPTPLRNVGIGFCDLMYRLASTVDPFGRYYLPKVHPQLLPLLYGSMSLLSAVLTLALPETMNKALDDGIFARFSRRISEIATQIRRASVRAYRRSSVAVPTTSEKRQAKETTAIDEESEDSTKF
ncbi:solute carrier family 22 member 12-like [Tropilaelaps mercedesae]|uniref:Solute carrier family 22 member 12-like n=1 Tax=Tropilaelaps mercedesae TaxID=418985 RepID=A0A1V9XTH2_9ACAR|nr:solute carrier family 22 member 12-like [Tropilaelaps mercedesae]